MPPELDLGIDRDRLGWEIETLADELAEALGRPVDPVSRRALHERIRDAVLADAQLIYAA